jgi:hypothetical protein
LMVALSFPFSSFSIFSTFDGLKNFTPYQSINQSINFYLN